METIGVGEGWADVGEKVGRDDSNRRLLLYSKLYPRRIFVSLRSFNQFLFMLFSKKVTFVTKKVIHIILMVPASI